MNPPVNGKIQGLSRFLSVSSTFQGIFNFQGLYMTVLYIQVLSSLCEPWLTSTLCTYFRLKLTITHLEMID